LGKPLNFSFLGSFCCLRFVILFQALAMLPKLQITNNFKFKYFLGGQVPRKAFAFNESIYFDLPKSNHMGEQNKPIAKP